MDGVPVKWPLLAFYFAPNHRPKEFLLLLTTTIFIEMKAINKHLDLEPG